MVLTGYRNSESWGARVGENHSMDERNGLSQLDSRVPEAAHRDGCRLEQVPSPATIN